MPALSDRVIEISVAVGRKSEEVGNTPECFIRINRSKERRKYHVRSFSRGKRRLYSKCKTFWQPRPLCQVMKRLSDEKNFPTYRKRMQMFVRMCTHQRVDSLIFAEVLCDNTQYCFVFCFHLLAISFLFQLVFFNFKTSLQYLWLRITMTVLIEVPWMKSSKF